MKDNLQLRLALDLGNTNQKAGIFRGHELIHLEQHPALRPSHLEELLGRFPADSGMAAAVVRFPSGVRSVLRDRLAFFLELDHRTPVPMVNRYQTPRTLGKDRLACAVAASRLFPGIPVVVVNAGTCITYDLVNGRGEYLGGAIAPGIRMRLKAMHTFTDKLPLVSLQDHQSHTGNSTGESLLSGALFGAVAEIEGMAARYKQDHPGIRVVVSGGDLGFLEKRLKIRIFAIPNLVMIGLNYILEYNLDEPR